jgi:hypothetical protein
MAAWLTYYSLSSLQETDNLEREGLREQGEAALQEEYAFNNDNGPALNPVTTPVPDYIVARLTKQTQQMVLDVKNQRDVFASELMNNGEVFEVSETVTTTTSLDGQVYDCKLHPGDFIANPSNVYSEPTLDGGGQPVLDPNNQPEQTTYVTMQVLHSKKGSCRDDLGVVVELSELQRMVDAERVRDLQGMEEAVKRHIRP